MDGAFVAGRYFLSREIGGGSFGKVYEAVDTETNCTVAAKIHSSNLAGSVENSVAEMMSGTPGFPTVRQTGDSFIVLELLGPSLRDLQKNCSDPWPLGVVLDIADQIFARIQALHRRNYIHRDVKPANLLLGVGANEGTVYLIDFGLATPFMDAQTGMHIRMHDHLHLTGNPRYASLNTHLGIEQSRRDDLEGAIYVLIDLLRGTLPWSTPPELSQTDQDRWVAQAKITTSIETICAGCPREFATVLRRIRELKFEEEPAYEEYRRVFRVLRASQPGNENGELTLAALRARVPPRPCPRRCPRLQVSTAKAPQRTISDRHQVTGKLLPRIYTPGGRRSISPTMRFRPAV
jgi:casein kinase 1